jgi:hypothetical protein
VARDGRRDPRLARPARLDRRDAVVLVPFVQLIDPLRRTLAAGGG